MQRDLHNLQKKMHLQSLLLNCLGITILYACQDQPETEMDADKQNNEVTIHQLTERLKALEAREQLSEEMANDLKGELANYKDCVNVIKEEVRQSTALIARLLSDSETDILGSHHREPVVPTAIRSRRAVSANAVNIAFTAGLSHNILNAHAYDIIVFDYVETNAGNGYNSRTGIFTAPVSGTYVFYTSILAYNGREIYCRFVVNGVNKANTYARGTDDRHDQGSQVIVVRLHQGDHVAVQNKMDGDAVFGNPDIWSTFSGFLLHSDNISG